MTILEQNKIISLLIKTWYYRYIIKYIWKFDKSNIRKIIKKIASLPSWWIYIFEFIDIFDIKDKEFIIDLAIKDNHSYLNVINSWISINTPFKNKIFRYYIKSRGWDILSNNMDYFSLSIDKLYEYIKSKPQLYNDHIIEKLLTNIHNLTSNKQSSILEWIIQEGKLDIFFSIYDSEKSYIDTEKIIKVLVKYSSKVDIFKYSNFLQWIDRNNLIQILSKKPRTLSGLSEHIDNMQWINHIEILNILIQWGYFPQIKRNLHKFNCDKEMLLTSLVKRQNEVKKALQTLGAVAETIESLH